MTDEVNPYLAPEAPIVALAEENRRPPVHTAISLFCWATGAFHLVACGLILFITARSVIQMGAGMTLRRYGLHTLLILILGLSATLSYFTAARWLRADRSRPGLILCGLAMGMTYLAIWLMNR